MSSSSCASGVSNKLTFSDFLKAQKALLCSNQPPSPSLDVVLGNPAGDADSIVSSLALAYIDYYYYYSSESTRTKIPLVSIPTDALRRQRPETKHLLDLAGLNIEDLICIDDPCLMEATHSSKQVTLVDHNRLVAPELLDSFEVTEILDHHMDEGHHHSSVESHQRRIAFDDDTGQALVASTCTLMVERIVESQAALLSVPHSLGTLLLGVILLDSVNLSEAAGKVTPRDRQAVEFLLEHTDWETHRPDTARLFDDLQSQKFNPTFWQGLTVQEGLQLDYKSFSAGNTTFGVSTVLQPLHHFLGQTDDESALEEAIDAFCTKQDISFLAVMCAFPSVDDPSCLQRQVAVMLPKEAPFMNDFVDYLQQSTDLELTPLASSTSLPRYNLFSFAQGNSKASRKQVAPLMMEFWAGQ